MELRAEIRDKISISRTEEIILDQLRYCYNAVPPTVWLDVTAVDDCLITMVQPFLQHADGHCFSVTCELQCSRWLSPSRYYCDFSIDGYSVGDQVPGSAELSE